MRSRKGGIRSQGRWCIHVAIGVEDRMEWRANHRGIQRRIDARKKLRRSLSHAADEKVVSQCAGPGDDRLEPSVMRRILGSLGFLKLKTRFRVSYSASTAINMVR